MNKIKTELYCHECGNDFTVELDMDLNGNHEIECPHCGHIHYRVIEDGEVTSDRYKSSMGTVQTNTWVTTTSYQSTDSSSSWTSDSWSSSQSASYYYSAS